MPTTDINRSPVSERIRELARDAQMRVLVVDDDELECALLADRLSACGLQITEATSGDAALEQVLIPDRMEDHEARFEAAGFGRVHTWFRCLNWVSYVAML